MKKLSILDVIACIVFTVFWVALIAVDSDTLMPLVVVVASWALLALYAWLKGWFYHPGDEKRKRR